MTTQMCGFFACLDAPSSLSSSPSSSRRFHAGGEGGIFTLSTGLADSINPHSFIAILRQCLIRMRSYWQVRRPSRSLRSLKAAMVWDVSWLTLRLLTGSLISLWRRWPSVAAPRLAGSTSATYRWRSWPKVASEGFKTPITPSVSFRSSPTAHLMAACFV